MKTGNHIFGTDRSLNKYVFQIVREDDELEKNIFRIFFLSTLV